MGAPRNLAQVRVRREPSRLLLPWVPALLVIVFLKSIQGDKVETIHPGDPRGGLGGSMSFSRSEREVKHPVEFKGVRWSWVGTELSPWGLPGSPCPNGEHLLVFKRPSVCLFTFRRSPHTIKCQTGLK